MTIGDLIPVRTGVIVDHNGHPVPDGTIVDFIISTGLSEEITQKESTQGGIARTTFLVEESGTVTIRARSDPAIESSNLQFDIPPGGIPTIEIVLTPFPTETPTPEPDETEAVAPLSTPETPTPPSTTGIQDWAIATIVSIVIGSIIYWFTTTFGLMRWGLRSGLLAVIGGLLAYLYIAFGLPGSEQLLQIPGAWGILIVTILGSGLGWGASFGWQKASASR